MSRDREPLHGLIEGTYWSIQDQADYPIPCNNEVGSPNLVTGEVTFSDYGYTLTRWVCYLCVVRSRDLGHFQLTPTASSRCLALPRVRTNNA